MVRSEFLRGHFGTYQTFRNPQNQLAESCQDALLAATAPGSEFGETIRDNQTWRCLEVEGRFFAVSTYSAPQTQRTGTIYQHARYFEAAPESLWKEMEASIFSAFADEAAFEAVARGDISVQENWLQEFGKMRRPPVDMRQPPSMELTLDTEAVAALAYACLYRGIVKDYSGLVVFVPKSYNTRAGTYLRYCRSIMLRVASCVPYGLRRYLSFATNPDSNGMKNFHVFFAPEGTELHGRQVGVSLPFRNSGRNAESMPEHSLPQDLARLIREAASSASVLEQVYDKLERGADLRSLEPKQYAQLQKRLSLGREPLDWKVLQEYQKQLLAPELDPREREAIRQTLLSQLGGGSLDTVLESAPELQKSAGIDQLMEALNVYSQVIRLLGKRLGNSFSAQLLRQCGASGWRLEEMNQTYYLFSQSSASGTEAGRGVLSLLDDAAFVSWLNELKSLIDRKNEEVRRDFLKNVPDLVRRHREWLPEAVQVLGECRKSVKTECLDTLTREAEELLKDSRVPEPEKRLCHEEISPYLEEKQRETLSLVFMAWEQAWKERQTTLDSMTSFPAYLALEHEDQECEDRLWEELQRSGGKDAGLGELLSAYEWTRHRPGLEIAGEQDMVPRFVRKYKMGIWVDRTTRLESLHKELLAYRHLCANERDVWLRSEQEKERKFPVSDLLDAVEFVWDVQNGASPEGDRWNVHNVRMENMWKFLAREGLLRGCGPEVESCLPRSVVSLLNDDKPQPVKAKRRDWDWKQIAILEGVIALIIILVLSAVLLFSRPAAETPPPDSDVVEQETEAEGEPPAELAGYLERKGCMDDMMQGRIARRLEEDYGELLTEKDCWDLAEDIGLVMEEERFKRPVTEWLNGKLEYTDVVVNGFSLVEVAHSLNEERPNIPVAALLLYLEENQPDPYRAIAAVAGQPCVADRRLIEDGLPCGFAVRSEEEWFFFLEEEQAAEWLREYQLWQILLLNPRLTLQTAYDHPDGTALVLQEDGSYLIADAEH